MKKLEGKKLMTLTVRLICLIFLGWLGLSRVAGQACPDWLAWLSRLAGRAYLGCLAGPLSRLAGLRTHPELMAGPILAGWPGLPRKAGWAYLSWPAGSIQAGWLDLSSWLSGPIQAGCIGFSRLAGWACPG
jgi:hypothetical protein